jgi:hypothetical protein
MFEGALLDNDVVLKATCYRLGDELVQVATVGEKSPAILQVAKYTLRDLIKKSKKLNDKVATEAELYSVLEKVEHLEPTDDEVQLAANFEQVAQESSLALDSGESQLLAILISRHAKVLLTGDKRAITAIEKIAYDKVPERISCIEQLASSLIALKGYETIRPRICAEAAVDITLSICFSCSVATGASSNTLAGLASYIRSLRSAAPTVLSAGDDLSAVLS